MAAIMKKPANMKKPTIAIRSKQEWNYEYFNQDGRFCCRFAAGAAIGNNWFNS